MTISTESTNRKNEILGILLFLIGVLPAVLVAMLMMRPPIEGQDMTFLQSFSSALVGAFGSAPVLMVSVAVAGLGGWMFTGGAITDPVRHLSAIVAVGAGAAISLGTFDPLLGGNLGQQIGGRLGEVHPMLGLLVGLGIAGAMAWNVWLQWLVPTKALRKKHKKEATIDDVLSEVDTDGVSEAETSALVPDEAALEHQEGLWLQSVDQNPAARSPYPEDVRLQGKIPIGVRALSSQDDEPQEPARAGSVQAVATSPEPQPIATGEDLAPAPSAVGGAESPEGTDDSLTAAQLLSAERGVNVEALQPQVESPAGGHLTPSWEQPDLFGLEEPEVIGADHSEEAEPEAEEAECEVDEEEVEYEDQESDEEETEYEDEDEDEDEDEGEEEAEYEEEGEEEAEYEEEEEEGDEEEEEGDEEAEYEEEGDEEAEYEEEEEEEEAEYEEEAEAEEEDCDEDEEASLEEDVPDPEPSKEVPAAVVLKPRKGKAKAAPVSRPQDLSPEELLAASGDLFLKEGRVAVSLLQRRFDLDFQAACEVLDRLQEAGLIGTYKGGQQRDILLTQEEWQSKVAAS